MGPVSEAQLPWASCVWQSCLTHILLEALSRVLHYHSCPTSLAQLLLAAASSSKGRDAWYGGVVTLMGWQVFIGLSSSHGE